MACWDLHTLNDNLAGDVAWTLIDMQRIFQGTRYLEMLEKIGDSLILAPPIEELEADVKRIIGALDGQGRWID